MNSIITNKMKKCLLLPKNTITLKVKTKEVLVRVKVQVPLKILLKQELSFLFPLILFKKSNIIKNLKVLLNNKLLKKIRIKT